MSYQEIRKPSSQAQFIEIMCKKLRERGETHEATVCFEESPALSPQQGA